jgi:colanic acid/amylovoran biosynthesis glycosyltransferase
MIAYLINQYPQSSQSFIRREILALEKLGQPIERFSVRRWETTLVDENDRAEQSKTRYVLDVGAVGLLLATLRTFLIHPIKFVSTLGRALKTGRRSQRGPLLHLIYLAEACVLLNWFKQKNISRVHCHFGTNSTTVALFTKFLGGPPYSFTIHGPEEWEKPEFIALGEKIHHAAFVAVISSFGLSQAYRWSDPADWPKLNIIRCGLDDQFLQAPKTAPPAEPRLVTVGRFGPAKGHLVLLQAAAQLAREGLPFEITFIGDGPLRPAIEQSIARHGLQNHIRLVGWKSNQDVLDAIQHSRALVLPSFSEGVPVVFMESLAL